MPTPALLLALVLQAPPVVKIAGRDVAMTPPAAPETVPAAEVAGWAGWGDLRGPFPAAYPGAPGEVATPLGKGRWKVFVQTTSDVVRTLPDGQRITARHFLVGPQLNATLATVAREAASAGVAADVELFEEPSRDDVGPDALPFGPAWRDANLGPRFNGGAYEGEDKVFRGPYDRVILLTAGPSDPSSVPVNGTPTSILPIFGVTPPLAARLRGLWAPDGGLATAGWAAPETKATLTKDPERGDVLLVTETASSRAGGIALPVPGGGIEVAKTPTLAFQAKQTGNDPFSLTLSGGGKTVSVALGVARDGLVGDPSRTAAFPRDSMWHRVLVDLKGLGLEGVDQILLGPGPAQLSGTKLAIAPIEIRLDEFRLLTEPAPAPVPADPEGDPRARRALAASADAATATRLAADLDPDVRLTAVERLAALGGQEVPLTAAAAGLDPRVAQAAIRGLAKIETETARAFLRRQIPFGVTGLAKAEAALALSDRPDPKLPGEILVLLANREGEVRLAGARALAKIPGREAGIIRTSFLRQTDPLIKLAVTLVADPDDEFQAGRLEWSAVNEPSDRVRLESAWRLARAKNPKTRAAGYRAVRDDSVYVRSEMVRRLGDQPDDLPYLRIAAQDADPSVRSLAQERLRTVGGGAASEQSRAGKTR